MRFNFLQFVYSERSFALLSMAFCTVRTSSAPTTTPSTAIHTDEILFSLITVLFFNYYTGFSQQVDTIREPVFITIDDPFDSGLDYKF